MLRPLLQSDVCRSGLALIFSLLMNGDIRDPPHVKHYALHVSYLFQKVLHTGVRPIAVGELFARVSCVFAMSTSSWHLCSMMVSNLVKAFALVLNVLC